MLTRSQLLDIYYWLQMTRTLEDRIVSLCRASKIPGTVYVSRGQEAISVGAAFALADGDVLSPMYRNLGALLIRGIRPREVLAQCMGRIGGPGEGRDGYLGIGDLRKGIIAPIGMTGTMVPVVAGAALAMKMLKREAIGLVFLGDGGTATTDFHEGLNLAAVHRVPMVLIVENNGWAFSTPTQDHAANSCFVSWAEAYGIKGFETDGNDVLDVFDTAVRSIELARRGCGPVLIEAKTMRMRGCTPDDAAWYVPRQCLDEWREKDPLRRFEKHLMSKEHVSGAELDAIRRRVRSDVDSATEAAEKIELPPVQQTLSRIYSEKITPL